MTLKNKVVVVIGAYGGVGSAVCRYNYEKGSKVVMVGRDRDKLIAEKNAYGDTPDILAIVGDANNPKEMGVALAASRENFGDIDEIWLTVGKDGGWEMDFPHDPEKNRAAISAKLYPSLLQPIEVIAPLVEEILRKQGHGIWVHLSSHAAFKEESELPGNHTYRTLKQKAEKLVLKVRESLKGTRATAINLRPAIIHTPGTKSLLGDQAHKAVQPLELAKWVDENAEDPNIPENQYFHSDVVL